MLCKEYKMIDGVKHVIHRPNGKCLVCLEDVRIVTPEHNSNDKYVSCYILIKKTLLARCEGTGNHNVTGEPLCTNWGYEVDEEHRRLLGTPDNIAEYRMRAKVYHVMTDFGVMKQEVIQNITKCLSQYTVPFTIY